MIKRAAIKVWFLFPNFIKTPIDIIRRSFVWKKHNIIFVHVPKAAGVSVNKAIYGKPLGHFYAKDIRDICPKMFNNTFKFSVVRHPIDRLYSAYNFSIRGGTSTMGMMNPDYYIKNPDFKSFEMFVNNWLSKKELTKIDHVFRPQYLYLFDANENLLVDKIYKLENIEKHLDEISMNIGKPFKLSHHNRSEKGLLKITDELKSLIFNLYQKDFELLDYSVSGE